jgi:hypothetical protein
MDAGSYGNPLLTLAIHGYPWTTMIINEYPWVSRAYMHVHRYWIAMGVHAYPSTYIHGDQRIIMDSHG